MSKLPVILAAIGLATTAGIASAAVSGDPQNGKEVANLCVACHQADGSGKHIEGGESWPRLAGLNATYLAKQLHDIKDGSRTSPTMMPFVNMLDDQKIADVAAYYSQLEPTARNIGFDDDDIRKQLAQLLNGADARARYIGRVILRQHLLDQTGQALAVEQVAVLP